MGQGDRPVLAHDIARKNQVEDEHNTLRHLLNKLGWENAVEDMAEEGEPGNHIALLAACCRYQTKICLISAHESDKWKNPIWLAPPDQWTRDDKEGGDKRHDQIRLERSPIFIAHLHDSQFFAVETAAQNARNKLRDEGLEKQRRQAAELANQLASERMAREEMGHVAEALLPDEDGTGDLTDFDQAFLEVLMPPNTDGLKHSTEELQQQEKLQEVLRDLTEEETFDLLFEYKCIFDVFDYDSSGVMRLDEVVRAFRFYGIDLLEEGSTAEGGYGKGSHRALEYLKRALPNQEITFTAFARKMLAERVTIAPQTELRNLIMAMEYKMQGDKRMVLLSSVNEVLASLGFPVESISHLDTGKDHYIDVAEVEAAFKGSAPKWATEDDD